MPETLYLTVTLLDQYLSLVTIKKTDMQLVGLTALLLASKYEDFWHPRVRSHILSITFEEKMACFIWLIFFVAFVPGQRFNQHLCWVY